MARWGSGRPWTRYTATPGSSGAGCTRPAHLALIGHGGDQAEPFASGVDANHRRLALRSVASSAHIIRAQAGLITPVNFGVLGLGAQGNLRVLLVQPLAHFGRALLVGFLDRLLRRETPALEVIANRADRQRDPVSVAHQLCDRLPIPQRKAQLQWIRRLVADQLPERGLLRVGELAAVAGLAAARLDLHRRPTTGQISPMCRH